MKTEVLIVCTSFLDKSPGEVLSRHMRLDGRFHLAAPCFVTSELFLDSRVGALLRGGAQTHSRSDVSWVSLGSQELTYYIDSCRRRR